LSPAYNRFEINIDSGLFDFSIGTLDLASGYGYQLCKAAKRIFTMKTAIAIARNSVRTILILSLCGAALLGCGKKDEPKTEAVVSQIVAHVGDDVVTIQELDTEFRLANVPVDKRKDPDTLKRILGDLVTRKYLVRQALDAKLDREPTVLSDILRARELVLANAVASRDVVTKSSAITKSDIDNYIANNPLKFANRRLVTVEQITFPLSANTQSLVDATKDMKTLDAVNDKLTMMNVPHNRSIGALSSGDISPDLYNKIQVTDDIFFVQSGSNGAFFKVKGLEAKPLEGEAAINLARQLLRLELMKTEASMAGVAAKLEAKYEGEYASLMATPQSAAPK
jgi:EpsD family peptidyl-prolyl cis-trans isomerase